MKPLTNKLNVFIEFDLGPLSKMDHIILKLQEYKKLLLMVMSPKVLHLRI